MFLDITDRMRTERQLMSALQGVMQDASWLSHWVMEKLAQTRGQQGTGPELSDLTTRERAVLECITKGKNNEQIGEELNLAPSTVRNYVTNVYSKIQVGSRAEAVVWARDRGLGGY
jgi:DNA-binding NarL/FixJ family response regulator